MASGKDIMMMEDEETGKVYILSLVTRLRVTLTSEKEANDHWWLSLVIGGQRN